jgi:hypothetical protein
MLSRISDIFVTTCYRLSQTGIMFSIKKVEIFSLLILKDLFIDNFGHCHMRVCIHPSFCGIPNSSYPLILTPSPIELSLFAKSP